MLQQHQDRDWFKFLVISASTLAFLLAADSDWSVGHFTGMAAFAMSMFFHVVGSKYPKDSYPDALCSFLKHAFAAAGVVAVAEKHGVKVM